MGVLTPHNNVAPVHCSKGLSDASLYQRFRHTTVIPLPQRLRDNNSEPRDGDVEGVLSPSPATSRKPINKTIYLVLTCASMTLVTSGCHNVVEERGAQWCLCPWPTIDPFPSWQCPPPLLLTNNSFRQYSIHSFIPHIQVHVNRCYPFYLPSTVTARAS